MPLNSFMTPNTFLRGRFSLVALLSLAASVGAHASDFQRKTDCVLNGFEQAFPSIFLPPSPSSVAFSPFYGRYYAATNIAVAASEADGNVYVGYQGGVSSYGSLDTHVSAFGCKPQSINKVTISPPLLATGEPATVSATATSGLPVSFRSTTPAVCSVKGTALTTYIAGTCTIVADQPGNVAFRAAEPASESVTVARVAPAVLALDVASISRSPWQAMITPGNVVTLPQPLSNPPASHGDKRYYAFAPALPASTDARWKPAPNADSINFRATSRLSLCMNQVDFSFFQTFVNIPAGTQVTAFSVNFSEADDGSRLTIFNAAYPDGLVVENSYTYLGGSQTADLSGYTAPGINRLLVTQLDDCPSGNNIGSALVVVNGSAIKTSQTINALSFSATSIEAGASAQITATATSGLPVALTSQTPAVCQVNGNSVLGVAAGTCTVSAAQAGDSRFHPATSVSGSLTVAWPAATGGGGYVPPL